MWRQSIWTPPHQSAKKLTDKLTEKNGCLRQKYGKFKLKTENVFGKMVAITLAMVAMVAITLKRINPYRKTSACKKINDILFKIKLSDYKQQQSYPINEFFGVLSTRAIILK